jgi:hypothetical protein
VGNTHSQGAVSEPTPQPDTSRARRLPSPRQIAAREKFAREWGGKDKTPQWWHDLGAR